MRKSGERWLSKVLVLAAVCVPPALAVAPAQAEVESVTVRLEEARCFS